jgi:hypothetical protein
MSFPPFPPSNPPFAVRDVTRIAADLYPMGSEINGRREEKHFIADEHWESEIAAKLALLERDASLRRCIVTDDPDGLVAALWHVAGLLANDEPTLWQMETDGAFLPRLGLRLTGDRICPEVDTSGATPLGQQIAAWLERQSGVARLFDALALACQEDIVIMRAAEQGPGGAEALHVCFPSGWDPREKAGRDFRAIHEPVGDNARLLSASANVMKALLTKGPYVRFSFGLSANPALDNHPTTRPPKPPPAFWDDPDTAIDSIYVRMERQTTYPMPDLDRGLFTIRVYVDPVKDRIARDPSLRPRLARLVETAIPDVRAYKGITEMSPALLEWLGRDQ